MQLKRTTIALSLLTAFSLVGCDNDSSSTTDNSDSGSDTYSITVIDGYLENAYVYASCDSDNEYDSEDLIGTTASDGTIEVSSDYQDEDCVITVKAVAGKTIDTGVIIENDYEMIAEFGSEVVTPFTTLASLYDTNIDDLASELGYDAGVISGDFIAKAADSSDDNFEDAQKAALLASTITGAFKDSFLNNNAIELVAATEATQNIINTLVDEEIELSEVTISLSTVAASEDNNGNISSAVTASVSVTSEGSINKEISAVAEIQITAQGIVTGEVLITNGEEEREGPSVEVSIDIPTDINTKSLASYIDDKTWYPANMYDFNSAEVNKIIYTDGEYNFFIGGELEESGNYSIEGDLLYLGDDSIDTFYYVSSDILISIDGNSGQGVTWFADDYSDVLTKDVATLNQETFVDQTWYLVGDSSLITLSFTDGDLTAMGVDNDEPWTEYGTWEIDGSKLTLEIEEDDETGQDAEVHNFTLINDNVNDVLVFVDTDNTEEIKLFIKNKATADALSEVLDASIAYSIPEGKVTFTDKGSIPDDAMVRIVPNTYSDVDNYSMALICDIDESGNFGTDCMIESGQKKGFDTVLADQNETYQVVVFKNHIESDENHWDCGEDVYKYVGGSESSWSSISISDNDYQERAGETCH